MFEISYQPRETESFDYTIKVSRDIYSGYKKYCHGAKSLEFTITISRRIDIREDFCAYLYGEVFREKTDEFKTTYEGNALWNGLGYKTKNEWEDIISKYETFGQLERDFLL